MTHQVEDYNRRDINFATDKVRELLPEYFLSEYPSLVAFLEAYYDYLGGTADDAFKTEINSLFAVRDIDQTTLSNLDELINEIGNGLQVASFFQEPRLMAKLLPGFYRSKGTLLSVEGFFRAFYNAEVTIEYPKDQIFIVGESEIGSESLRYIVDNRLYQIFSILIKSGISVADYQQLYKRFVHPAGFYFAGQVSLETDFALNLATAPGIEDPLDSAAVASSLVGTASLDPTTGFAQITGLVDSSDGKEIRIALDQDIAVYEDLSSTVVDGFYENIRDVLTPNSFTFDDSADPVGPDMSLSLENMDNTMFTRYTSDSSI